MKTIQRKLIIVIRFTSLKSNRDGQMPLANKNEERHSLMIDDIKKRKFDEDKSRLLEVSRNPVRFTKAKDGSVEIDNSSNIKAANYFFAAKAKKHRHIIIN